MPEDGTTRICVTCRETKLITEFFRDSARPDGLRGTCKGCNRVAGATYRAKHREVLNARAMEWRAAHPEKMRAYSKANRERISHVSAQWDARNKAQAFAAYGGDTPCCACCSESTLGFLSIDHIDGGGRQHRLTPGSGAVKIYRWLKKNGYPDGYRLLCFNCNVAMGIYGRCPHEDLTAGDPFHRAAAPA